MAPAVVNEKQRPSAAEAAELFQAQAHIYRHVSSFIDSMALRSAVELGIPDAIHAHDEPITLPDLVSALKISPAKTNSLFRLMRLLAHSGFFSAAGETESETESRYALTPSSKLLLKDHPNSLATVAKLIPRPEFATSSYMTAEWMRQEGEDGGDKTAFEKAYGGRPFWEYSQGNPEFNALFNDAMANDSGMMKNLVAGDCEVVFQGVESLIDVGGGNGTAAGIISKAFPWIQCKVLDLPQVIAGVQSNSGEVELIQGDMFQHIPSAQAVMLKSVLHDWDDEECVKILKGAKEAILRDCKAGEEDGRKVIVIDIVVNEKNDDGQELAGMKLRFDMLMLVLVNGKERSEKEWERLFLEAGFKHYKITPLFGFSSLIEVFP